MNSKNLGLYFFVAVFLAVFVAIFFIFRPFLYPLVLAVVFVTIFGPVHRKIIGITNGRSGLAAFISTMIVLIVVIVPITFLGFQILKEVSQLYSTISTAGGSTELFGSINEGLRSFLGMFPVSLNIIPDVEQYLNIVLNWLLAHLDQIFLNIASMVMNIFIFLFALYYLSGMGV